MTIRYFCRLILSVGLITCATFLVGCPSSTPTGESSAQVKSSSAAPMLFQNVLADSQIDFAIKQDHSPLTIQETLGHGVALADFDGDGLLDILLVGPDKVHLYRNLGNYRFEDITAASGLRQPGFWEGVAVGDWDNDGKPDLYICGYNCSALYHNEGGGRFHDVTDTAGLTVQKFPNGIGDWRTSAGFADLDGDGRLDLYVCRYVAFGKSTAQLCKVGNFQTACSPEAYKPQRGTLYRNIGSGKFVPVNNDVLDKVSGAALGVAFADYTNDGRFSIAIANDERPGDLLENLGNFQFTNRGTESGVSLSTSGHAVAGMGIDWGDYDSDGKIDLFVTSFANEGKPLYHNLGGGLFADSGNRMRLTGLMDKLVSFGCKFIDYDNDGNPDLIVTSGHVNDNTDKLQPGSTFAQPLLLFHNEGSQFVDTSSGLQPVNDCRIVGRGLAVGDLNNSGSLDVVVTNMNGAPLLLRNRSDTKNHWATFTVTGTKSNRDGIGARISVTAGGKTHAQTVTNSGSFMSASDLRVHFGLGTADKIGTATVRWQNGQKSVFKNLPADRFYRITEGDTRIGTIPAQKTAH